MTSALSPVAKKLESLSKGETDVTTPKEFGKIIEHLQESIVHIFKFAQIVYSLPAKKELTVAGGIKISRKQVNDAVRAYVHQLGDLRKLYNKKKKRSGNGNTRLTELFHVSEQIVNFYKGADLGLVDPNDPESGDLKDEIDLITKYGMANSGLLTSLFARYINANGLKNTDDDKRGYFTPDKHMEKCFSNTKFILDGKDISKRKLPVDISPEKAEDIKEKVSQGKLSAIKRLDGRTDKGGKPYYDEEKGLGYNTMMIISNYYRIPKQLLTKEEREELQDSDAVQMANELSAKLKTK